MQLKSKSAALAATVLCGALLTTLVSASTEADQQYSALQGVEAQALSAAEMDGIHGAVFTAADAALVARLDSALITFTSKLTNTTLAAAILARWNTVTKPRLIALLTKY